MLPCLVRIRSELPVHRALTLPVYKDDEVAAFRAARAVRAGRCVRPTIVGLGDMGRSKRAMMALLAGMLWPMVPAGAQDADFGMLERTPGLQLIAAVDAMHSGDLTKANALFTLVIERKELAPEGLAHALYNRALVRQRMGWHAQAVEDFNKAIDSNVLSIAGRVNAYYNRGLALRRLGRLQAALNDFTRAIELNPRFAPAYYSRALGLAAKGHYILALTDFEKALQYGHPEPHRAWYGKALTHLARGEYQPARKALKAALKLKPDFTPARERLAMVTRLASGPAPLRMRRSVALGDVQGGTAFLDAGGHEAMALAAAEKEAASSRPAAVAISQQPAASNAPARSASAQAPLPNSQRTAHVLPRKRPAQPRKVAVQQQVQASRNDAAPARPAIARNNHARSITNTGMAVPGTGVWSTAGAPLLTASIAPSATTRVAGNNVGSWSIQIASQPTAELAKQVWSELRARVRRLVAQPRPHIARARVRGRMAYRLRLTGYTDRRTAQADCSRLKSGGISCFVVKAR